MSVRYLLLLVLSHQAYSYYFYNPSTQLILSLPSLRGKPHGFKLIPAPRSRTNFVFRKDTTPNAHCTESGFRCTNPYSRAQTYQFECERDSQCPTSFKCCPQKCFQHKICVKAKLQAKKPKISNSKTGDPQSSKENPRICETYSYRCTRPFSYTSTSMFECRNDNQCPKSFKCCPQSCFVHKICSRTIPSVGISYLEEAKQKENMEVTEPSTSENVTPIGEEATEDVTEEGIESTTEIIETTAADLTTETEEVTVLSSSETVSPIGEEATEDVTEEGVQSTTETNKETIETTVQDLTTETEEVSTETTITTTTSSSSTSTTTDVTTMTGEETIFESTTTERITSTEEETETPILEPHEIIAEEVVGGEEIGELVSINSLNLKALKTTPDPNSIVPEYSEYYYDYANRNDTEQDDDDDY